MRRMPYRIWMRKLNRLFKHYLWAVKPDDEMKIIKKIHLLHKEHKIFTLIEKRFT